MTAVFVRRPSLPANPVPQARHAVRFVETQPAASKAEILLAAVERLAPQLAARSEAIARERRIPADIIETLRRVGLFGAFVPQSHGGLQLTVPEIMPVIETLAAAEASVGWVAMIGMNSQLFCTRLARETYDRVYAGRGNAVVVGSGLPVGRAEIVDGGYRVSGRWPLASGCLNASWLMGHCILCRGDEPVICGGHAVTRFVLLPADRWRIDDTWQGSGLAGSGSHHIGLDDVQVMEAETFDPSHGASIIQGPLANRIAPFIVGFHGAVATGIARGAIADLVAAAQAGWQQSVSPADLRNSPLFQLELGRLGAQLRAARALLQVQAAEHWRNAITGAVDGYIDFAAALQASAWIYATCTDIVDRCCTLADSSTAMASSPLQRRLRDIHAARQHIYAQDRFYAPAARHLLGFAPADPVSGQ